MPPRRAAADTSSACGSSAFTTAMQDFAATPPSEAGTPRPPFRPSNSMSLASR
jgi:hypothetical protein